MTIMEQVYWNALMNVPITMDAANDGIAIALLLVAGVIILLKPDFSRL